jgi:DNA-binding LacI/PurR family transcriptional regulator
MDQRQRQRRRQHQHQHFGDLIRELRLKAGWTQAELAERAGLGSHAVVARAERNGQPTLPVARQIVEALLTSPDLDPYWWELNELAVRLLYSPERLATRDDPTILGLLLPGVSTSPLWAAIAGAIETRAGLQGHLLSFCQHEDKSDLFFSALYRFEEYGRLAGVIAAAPHLDGSRRIARRMNADLEAVFDRLAARGVPIVFVDRRPPATIEAPFVGLDETKAAEEAIAHLRRRGHRRIGGLFGVQDDTTPHPARLAGYRAALSRRGQIFDDRLIRCLKSEGADGVRLAQELIDLPPEIRPTAIFCATNALALAVVEAVKRRRAAGQNDVEIPRTLSVLAFDHGPVPESAHPRINRASLDVRALAQVVLDKVSPPSDAVNEAPLDREVQVGSIRVSDGDSIAPPPAST